MGPRLYLEDPTVCRPPKPARERSAPDPERATRAPLRLRDPFERQSVQVDRSASAASAPLVKEGGSDTRKGIDRGRLRDLEIVETLVGSAGGRVPPFFAQEETRRKIYKRRHSGSLRPTTPRIQRQPIFNSNNTGAMLQL